MLALEELDRLINIKGDFLVGSDRETVVALCITEMKKVISILWWGLPTLEPWSAEPIKCLQLISEWGHSSPGYKVLWGKDLNCNDLS